ncbi:hypothetical protein [Methanospirillum sp.]
MTDSDHEFLIIDRTIGAPIDHADTFRELIEKLAYHLRFYKDEKFLGFSIAGGPEGWSWNLEIVLVIGQEFVREKYMEENIRISPDFALQQAKETILHITSGVPVGFKLEEVAVV